MLQILEEESQGDVHKEEFKPTEVTPEKKVLKKPRTKVFQKILTPADLERVREVEASYQKATSSEKVVKAFL
ncbi:class I SAM-dependent methyltransferase [Sesbania bispinosa]|nr:class I SAM-dependent methyltransferase [Sesbania bispinosa]